MKISLYILLMFLLSPLFLLGLPFFMVPILRSRGKVSGTAYEPFNGRLLYHMAGTRIDTATMQLAGGLPATNRVFMALLARPLVWASRITGYTPAMLQYPPPKPTPISAMVGARCEFLDSAIRNFLTAGDQVVILGAGWDTRAYGLLRGREVKVFEVDAPATQEIKRHALEQTRLDASDVTFVSCDFNRQNWLDALKENGFDSDRRTFILWEGVTMYLEESAINDTLRAVSDLPFDSRIAFDFFSREWLNDTIFGKMARWAVDLTYGEPFTFGFPVQTGFPGSLQKSLEEHGLALENSRPLGDVTKDKLPYGGLVLAMKPDSVQNDGAFAP